MVPSCPSVNSRILLATVLLISSVAGAGCSSADDYTTEIGEPTNGTVIDTLTIVDINEIDGARYKLQHRLNASEKYLLYC